AHQDGRPLPVGSLDDLGHGVDGAQHVGDVGEGAQPGLGGDEAVQVGHIEGPVGVHGDVAEAGAAPAGGQLPGDEVAVVLHGGEEDLVPLPEAGPVTVGHQVDGLGGVPDEDDLRRLPRVDEAEIGRAHV